MPQHASLQRVPAKRATPMQAPARPATRRAAAAIPAFDIRNLAVHPPSRHSAAAQLQETGPGQSTTGPIVQGVFLKAPGVTMTDPEFEAAFQGHASYTKLNDAQKTAIRARHQHKQHYHLNNTIEGYETGRIVPPSAMDGGKPKSRRVAAGYVNPPHMDASVIRLFRDAAVSPIPDPSIRSEREHLASPSRHFRTFTPTHTQPARIVKGHSNTVMGHGPIDAVDDWNNHGHKRSRAQNLAHNRDSGIYHGLEEAGASAKSGGNTRARYLSPSPTHGSHPSHYLRDDPGFDPMVPWHTYANANDAQNRVRYVPQPTSSIVPQTAALIKPAATAPKSAMAQAHPFVHGSAAAPASTTGAGSFHHAASYSSSATSGSASFTSAAPIMPPTFQQPSASPPTAYSVSSFGPQPPQAFPLNPHFSQALKIPPVLLPSHAFAPSSLSSAGSVHHVTPASAPSAFHSAQPMMYQNLSPYGPSVMGSHVPVTAGSWQGLHVAQQDNSMESENDDMED